MRKSEKKQIFMYTFILDLLCISLLNFPAPYFNCSFNVTRIYIFVSPIVKHNEASVSTLCYFFYAVKSNNTLERVKYKMINEIDAQIVI